MERMHARRLLSAAVASTGEQVATAPTPRSASAFSSLDATVITILSLLLCALVVALLLHALVRCAFRVTRRACYGQDEEPPGVVETAAPRARKKGGKGGAGAAIRALPTMAYSAETELAVCGSTECTICLAEFAPGERVRVLPGCSHGFHARCIDRWLSARPTCPTCRRQPFAKPAVPTPAEEPAPVQLLVNVDAGRPGTI
ncbi:RING-H2 finger protein ATL72 [Brachypodium distachyon]|uniref:RING-type domain-containing protein n=1 Tax=Brachypodium distachyon TaxID=15368 RepID=I1HTQ4_BRADI|nr:RING-H2 finger protein ATL72 [Brachypodium distachyon]KQK10758.1 hypothetical protein BRADI_2g55990v3 [Brachypodium distachyon]|eukprot:XP_003567306.1 RING-H2 finger protein ATL72 [Brachypodium distachyon]